MLTLKVQLGTCTVMNTDKNKVLVEKLDVTNIPHQINLYLFIFVVIVNTVRDGKPEATEKLSFIKQIIQ